MHFANPEYLFFLLIIPFMITYYVIRSRKKRVSIRFSNTAIFKDIAPSIWQKGFYLLPFLRMAGLVFIIIALARPQFGRSFEDILTQGIDIILAVDVSGSMQAEDLKPNRVEVAKQVVEEFIDGRINDRIGLVVFAGIAYSVCPPTMDYNILKEYIKQMNIGMAEDGTAIGMGIVSSLNRLKNSKAKSKVIVLLTDGENNRGQVDPITAGKMAQALGVKIYTIGVGQEGGAPIPVAETIFGKEYARNPDGSLMLTYLDEKSLKKIADITGGKYFRATDEHKLREIYKVIGELEKTDIKSRKYTQYSETFMYFLIPGLFLLLIEILLGNTKFMKIP